MLDQYSLKSIAPKANQALLLALIKLEPILDTPIASTRACAWRISCRRWRMSLVDSIQWKKV